MAVGRAQRFRAVGGGNHSPDDIAGVLEKDAHPIPGLDVPYRFPAEQAKHVIPKGMPLTEEEGAEFVRWPKEQREADPTETLSTIVPRDPGEEALALQCLVVDKGGGRIRSSQ